MAQKKDKGPFILIAILSIIAVVGALAFLYGKDDYNGVEITGIEVLGRIWPSFWVWVAVCTALGLASVGLAYLIYKGIGIGNWNIFQGDSSYIWALAIGCILVVAPWGVACGHKANGGFTLPKTEVKP